jgi:hypothetical protein
MRGETPIGEVIDPLAVTPGPLYFTPHPTSLRSATFSLKGRRNRDAAREIIVALAEKHRT